MIKRRPRRVNCLNVFAYYLNEVSIDSRLQKLQPPKLTLFDRLVSQLSISVKWFNMCAAVD